VDEASTWLTGSSSCPPARTDHRRDLVDMERPGAGDPPVGALAARILALLDEAMAEGALPRKTRRQVRDCILPGALR
jgi:hypothetical protein